MIVHFDTFKIKVFQFENFKNESSLDFQGSAENLKKPAEWLQSGV